MKSSSKLKPNYFDLLPILCVIALAAACGFGFWGRLGRSDGEIAAVITAGSQVVETIDLSRAQPGETFTCSHNGYTLTLNLNPEGVTGVAVVASDCPGGDCVRTGAITQPGESIVCLPGRVVITLTGGDGGVDAVIG